MQILVIGTKVNFDPGSGNFLFLLSYEDILLHKVAVCIFSATEQKKKKKKITNIYLNVHLRVLKTSGSVYLGFWFSCCDWGLNDSA